MYIFFWTLYKKLYQFILNFKQWKDFGMNGGGEICTSLDAKFAKRDLKINKTKQK